MITILTVGRTMMCASVNLQLFLLIGAKRRVSVILIAVSSGLKASTMSRKSTKAIIRAVTGLQTRGPTKMESSTSAVAQCSSAGTIIMDSSRTFSMIPVATIARCCY
jgi:hypothetical protein